MVTRSLNTPPAGRGFRQTIARVLPGLKATPLETQARRKQCQGPWTHPTVPGVSGYRLVLCKFPLKGYIMVSCTRQLDVSTLKIIRQDSVMEKSWDSFTKVRESHLILNTESHSHECTLNHIIVDLATCNIATSKYLSSPRRAFQQGHCGFLHRFGGCCHNA